MGWRDGLAAADAAVALYFDEDLCTAIAMTKPGRAVNGPPEADPARISFDFRCTIEMDPSITAMSNHSETNPSDRMGRQVSRTCLTALVTDWPWVPRQGDQIVFGATRFAVAANAERDGTDRVVLWLNRAKD